MSITRKESRKVYFINLVLRIFAPVLLWVNPIAGYLVNLTLDAIDGYYAAHAGLSKSQYNKFDKLLDYWFYVAVLVYILSQPMFEYYRVILLGLFVFRSIGQFGYMLTGNRKMFVIFPNYFENVFVLILIAYSFPGLEWILSSFPIVFIVMGLRLGVELILHYFNYPIGRRVLHLNMVWRKEKQAAL